MEKPIISFDEFELDFLIDSNEHDEDLDNDEIKDEMISRIPSATVFLGSIETEIDNWTSWQIRDEYYIHPITDDAFDWALFRISWDDNWGCWNWSFDARLKGFKDSPDDAAKFILPELWAKWHIDLNDSDYAAFKEFLEGI